MESALTARDKLGVVWSLSALSFCTRFESDRLRASAKCDREAAACGEGAPPDASALSMVKSVPGRCVSPVRVCRCRHAILHRVRMLHMYTDRDIQWRAHGSSSL